MGIHGLTSYAKSVGTLCTEIQLKQTKIIIDGSALLWNLYRPENGIDRQAGGNYDELAEVMKRFFQALDSNGIEPFVIIDGPTVSKDKKLERIKERFEKEIESSYNLSRGFSGGKYSVLPLLNKGVFIQELDNLGIQFAVCDCEADQEVASLANQWNCPVISNDSDYFIFDLPAGYIPLSSLDWSGKTITGSLYKRQRLADHLKIRPTLLPLFASLLGNDFIEEHTLAPFERALLSSPSCRGRGNRNTIRINKIAEILSDSADLDKALNTALGLVPNVNQRATLKAAIEESLKEYEISDVTLRGYFELGEIRTSLKTWHEQEDIPQFIIKRYRQGLFPRKYMSVMTSGRHTLSVQVENINESSAHDCALELRRIIYGILFNQSRESKTKEIEVWSRDRRSLRKSLVHPFREPIPGLPGHELPTLENLEETDIDQRRKLLLVALHANTEAVKSLPKEFQLFAASVRYWICKASPPVDPIWVQALLLVHLQLLARSEEKSFRDQRNQKRLLRSDFDIDCQHGFAQWQAVMLESTCLNQILLDPFVAPKVSTLYNGVMVQSIVQEMKEGKKAKSFIETTDIFKDQLYTAVTEGLEVGQPQKEKIFESSEQSLAKLEKKKKEPPRVLQGNRFAWLWIEESDDESDESDDESDET